MKFSYLILIATSVSVLFLTHCCYGQEVPLSVYGYLSNSRLIIGLFIFNELRDFSVKPFVNFLPVRPYRPIL